MLNKKACDGNDLNLFCPPNEYLKIISANYGRTDPVTCGEACVNTPIVCAVTTCIANQLDYVSTRCNSRQSCTIAVSNAGFRAPCSGTFKYLDVYYSCGRAYINPNSNGISNFKLDAKKLELLIHLLLI